MKKFLLITLCGLSSLYVNAQLCLSPAFANSVGASPSGGCVGDFNGDGKKDIATTVTGINKVSILLGDGTGGFGPSTNFTTGSGPHSVCTADFNADGFADLAVADNIQNKVSILLGTGTGSFGAPTNFAVGTGPQSVCTADFNADGKMDLATANYTANNVSVLLGNGNGTFGAATNIITMSNNPYQIITADFNGDGKPDLATANILPSGNISVYLNQGGGTIGMGTIFGTGTNASSLCSGDFNGDTFIDIAVTFSGDGTMTILPNNGSGSFYVGTQTNFNVGTNPNGICAADLDGDGKLDVAVTDDNNTQIFVMLGNGASGLGSPMPYTVGTNPCAIMSSDLDANGRKDLILSNNGSNYISVFLNGPPHTSISGILTACSGTTVYLGASMANTYSWSSGGTAQLETLTPPTGTTSYTLTEANGTCTATAVATVTVTATPTISISGNLNICSGNGTTLTGGTAASYTWDAGAGSANTNTVSVTPGSTTTYTLTGANGTCTTSAITTVNVTNTPTVNISGTMAICSGQSTTLSGQAPSAGSYTWSSGGSSQTTTVSPTSTTNYTLTEANGVCVVSGVVTVTVTPTPTVNISGVQNICFGNGTVLHGSGATTYTWSTNAGSAITNTVSVNPIPNNNTYTLTGGNPLQGGSGECDNSTTATVNVVQVQTPNICMVSSDSTSTNNIIFWDKTVYTNMDSFIVYREVSTNTYNRIGAVSKNSLSMFVDVNRAVGPANGDPNVGFYRYKLQLRDTCGNYSAMSPYHTSVYFIDNHTGTFTWNTYSVEGQATPVANFILRRDNANNGVYVVVGNVSGNTTTLNDANYSTYQTIANWRVDATGFNCTPTARYGNNSAQSAIVKSKSNISNNRSTLVKNTESNFSVYPNPTNGNLTISFTNSPFGKVSVKVMSAIGQEVYSETFTQTNENHHVDLSKYESGIYLVQITTSNSTVIKRVVKN